MADENKNTNQVKLTIMMDKRLKKALKILCSFKGITIGTAIKYAVAFYILNNGILPNFSMENASRKVLEYINMGKNIQQGGDNAKK